MTKKDNAVKTIALMMFISVIGKILGLVREMMFGYNFGTTSMEGTAFTYASNLPNQFLDIMFASSITSSFIPIFNNHLENEGKDSAFKLFSNFLSIIIFLAGIVIFLAAIFSMQIVNIIAPGLDLQTKLLTARLLKIVLPVLMFSGIAFSMTGVLQSFGKFNITSAMSIFFNGVIIFYYIFLIKKFGVYGLAVAFTLGWLMQLLIQIPFLHSQNYKFHFAIDLKSDGIHEILKLMLPVLVSSWVMPINNLVNSNVASYIEGGANALKMANTVYIIVTGTFVLSVNNFMFQRLSKLKANNSQTEFNSALKTSISNMFYFLIPLTFILMMFSTDIVSILFERGKFDTAATNLTARALFFYSIGIVGYGIQTILNSSFYAAKNGKIPLVSAIIALVINFLLSFTLVKFLDIGGPALASSVAIDFIALFMLVIANKNKFINRKFLLNIVKIILASLFMSVTVFYLYRLLPTSSIFLFKFLSLAITCLIGFVIYIFITFLFKLDEAIFIKNMVVKSLYIITRTK